jgi:hypothetical protein
MTEAKAEGANSVKLKEALESDLQTQLSMVEDELGIIRKEMSSGYDFD